MVTMLRIGTAIVAGFILSACAQDPILVSGDIPDKKAAPIAIALVDVGFAPNPEGVANYRQDPALLDVLQETLDAALVQQKDPGTARPVVLELRITDAAQVDAGARTLVGGYQQVDLTVSILDQETKEILAVYTFEEEKNDPSFLWPAFSRTSPQQRVADHLADRLQGLIY